jgi:hypothetical protein
LRAGTLQSIGISGEVLVTHQRKESSISAVVLRPLTVTRRTKMSISLPTVVMRRNLRIRADLWAVCLAGTIGTTARLQEVMERGFGDEGMSNWQRLRNILLEVQYGKKGV